MHVYCITSFFSYVVTVLALFNNKENTGTGYRSSTISSSIRDKYEKELAFFRFH